jgi:rhodanese-related sulfurtransferase
MKPKFFLILFIFLIFSFSINLYAESSLPEKKQTALGLYITAKAAFTKLHTEQKKIKLLDVRTPGEYLFVGHAPMATNIPVKFFKDDVDEKMKPIMVLNEHFVDEVKQRFKTTDTIMVMCRSGGRSAAAVNILAKAGFKSVYNVTDGFEGDVLNISGSYKNGKRILNGWRNSGAPWTYELDPRLVYRP